MIETCQHKRKNINAAGFIYCFDCGATTGERAIDRIAYLEHQLSDAQAELAEVREDLASECEARKDEYNRCEDLQVEVERLRELLWPEEAFCRGSGDTDRADELKAALEQGEDDECEG